MESYVHPKCGPGVGPRLLHQRSERSRSVGVEDVCCSASGRRESVETHEEKRMDNK